MYVEHRSLEIDYMLNKKNSPIQPYSGPSPPTHDYLWHHVCSKLRENRGVNMTQDTNSRNSRFQEKGGILQAKTMIIVIV